MSKEFDVHFLLKFSEFFGSIEAKSKEEAKQIARGYLDTLEGLSLIKEKVLEYLDDSDFEFEVTDVLEVGKDI